MKKNIISLVAILFLNSICFAQTEVDALDAVQKTINSLQEEVSNYSNTYKDPSEFFSVGYDLMLLVEAGTLDPFTEMYAMQAYEDSYNSLIISYKNLQDASCELEYASEYLDAAFQDIIDTFYDSAITNADLSYQSLYNHNLYLSDYRNNFYNYESSLNFVKEMIYP